MNVGKWSEIIVQFIDILKKKTTYKQTFYRLQVE